MVVIVTRAGLEYAALVTEVLFGTADNPKPWYPCLVAIVSTRCGWRGKRLKDVSRILGFSKSSPSGTLNPFPCPVVAIDDCKRNFQGEDEPYRVLVNEWSPRNPPQESPMHEKIKQDIMDCIRRQTIDPSWLKEMDRLDS